MNKTYVFPTGKYAETEITEVPAQYLAWVETQFIKNKERSLLAKKELERRGYTFPFAHSVREGKKKRSERMHTITVWEERRARIQVRAYDQQEAQEKAKKLYRARRVVFYETNALLSAGDDADDIRFENHKELTKK